MSSITGLISGGGGGTPINSISKLYVGGETLYTDESGGKWLKTGNVISPADLTEYPDAYAVEGLASAIYKQPFYVGGFTAEPVSLFLNNDGTKIFVSNMTNDSINEFHLSTAYDISTAAFARNFVVGSQDGQQRGVAFSSDGTKMHVIGTIAKRVFQYNLTTGFDLSTASYSGISFNYSAQNTGILSLCFNNDGSKMYLCGNEANVFQYSLSTPYSVNTASYDNIVFDLTPANFYAHDLCFNSNGTVLFITNTTDNKVYQLELGTAYDLSTAVQSSVTLSVVNDSALKGIISGNNDTKLYVVGDSTDRIFEYDTISFQGVSTDTGTYDYLKLK